MIKNLNEYIDHTVLKPDADENAVKKLCEEAKKYGFKSVCVNSSRIELASKLVAGSSVTPCCVVGFPLGAMMPSAKAFETAEAVRAGAREIDMVMNIGAAKDGDWETVENDIKGVVAAANGGAKVKVIIETCLLTDEEKIRACECAVKAGADFVKTSTGFSTGGATEGDVELMRKTVGDKLGVKASGGIRTRLDAEKMIAAGADRIGTSGGVKMIEEKENA